MSNQAILYVRYSPRPDADECDSIDQQLGRLKSYCALQGLEIAHTIEEPEVSAYAVPMGERNGGAELLRLLKSKRVRHVVAQRLDRLFRNTADCLATVRRWTRVGVRLHLADQGGCSLDCSTSTGWFMLTVLAGCAQLERDLISERTSQGMRRHQQNGRHMGGRVPFGFRLEGGRLVPVPEEREQVGRIVSLRLQGWSLRGIADELSRKNIECRGGRWSHQTVKAILRREAANGPELSHGTILPELVSK
jgi:DNA invertase Pin-like site-specific DNA recombinase